LFRELVKFAFSQRRKQLATIFRQAPPALRMDAPRLRDVLAPWNIAPTDRPESLPPAAFIALADALATSGSNRENAGQKD
jgi:16S rRNA A1518/A1519 N6-dimethyltransferase RsmA/KsgA/DIM1 with predicted DNA glycosylase/AP lyase activity